MILNGDHECFGMKRAVVAFDQDAIGELQRTVEHKQNFVRRAELDDGVLKKDVFVLVFAGGEIAIGTAVAVSVAVSVGINDSAAELDRDPHRSGFGKEPGQAAYDVWFERASSCLVGHGKTSTPEFGAAESPLFPVWKNYGETRSALSAFRGARAPPKTRGSYTLEQVIEEYAVSGVKPGSERLKFPGNGRVRLIVTQL